MKKKEIKKEKMKKEMPVMMEKEKKMMKKGCSK